MTVQPLEITIADLEYEQKCYESACDSVSTWHVWGAHMENTQTGTRCCEQWANLCDAHKSKLERETIKVLSSDYWCTSCGRKYAGQLSDNFRAIRL